MPHRMHSKFPSELTWHVLDFSNAENISYADRRSEVERGQEVTEPTVPEIKKK